MIHIVPFALGALAGAIGMRLLKGHKAKADLQQATAQLRQATLQGLSAVEQGSAKLRQKIEAAEVKNQESKQEES